MANEAAFDASGPGRTYLSPGLIVQIAILIGATALGVLVYTWTVRGADRGLYRAYYEDGGPEGNVISRILAEDPFVDQSREPDLSSTEGQKRTLLRTLQLLGMVTSDTSLQDLDEPGFEPLHQIFFGQRDSKVHLLESRSVELLVHLAQQIPGAQTTPHGLSPSQVREWTGQIVAASLADQPGIIAGYRRVLGTLAGEGGASEEQFQQLRGHLGDDFAGGLSFFQGLHFTGSQPRPETEILNLLFTQTRVTDCYSPLHGAVAGAASNCPLQPDQYRFVSEFAERLVSRLHASTAVKSARNRIALWQGAVQLALWICFFWMSGLLLARTFLRRREQKDAGILKKALRDQEISIDREQRQRVAGRLLDGVRRKNGLVDRLVSTCLQHLETPGSSASQESLEKVCQHIRAREAGSRWTIQWLASALPALGFIGTVYGIADALKSADTIVRAQTIGAQAAAITGVAGSLGVAFTTTLIALVMGLITSLINDHQAYRERALINGIEEDLMPLIDPATTYDAGETGDGAVAEDRPRAAGARR